MLFRVDLVEIEKLPDFADREPEPLAAQDQLHPAQITLRIDPCGAYSLRADQPLVLVEAQGAVRHAEFARHLLNALDRAVGRTIHAVRRLGVHCAPAEIRACSWAIRSFFDSLPTCVLGRLARTSIRSGFSNRLSRCDRKACSASTSIVSPG